MSKPTFVLVHGAWHSPAHLAGLSTELKQRGYEIMSGQLPSVGPRDPESATLEADAEYVKEHLLLPLNDQCKDLVVVAHSYGGCVASTAAKGLSKLACSSHGKQGGILGLVYIAGWLLKEGQSILGCQEGVFKSEIQIVSDGPGVSSVLNCARVFFHDVPDAAASQAVAALRPQSAISFSSPCPAPAWEEQAFAGRCAYIGCLEDKAIPCRAQDEMLKASGVEWLVKTLRSGHSPFLNHTQETAECLVEWADKFCQLV